ncbi:MAG: DUF4468 domain-containing protein [Flavobacteriales bacterium]|nr:DUF4468 domain-containing protein [Flavobacteriales bacterium]
MRYPIATPAVVLSLTSIAQKPYERTKVVEIDTVTTADVLRAKARKWFVDTFKDANEVIQMDDAATNTIVGKGLSKFNEYSRVNYTIEVSARKGKVRIRIYAVHHNGIGGSTVAGMYFPAPTMGNLYDEERCYTPKAGASERQAKKAEENMYSWCSNSRPIIDEELDRIVQSFEAAMKTAAASSSDDW